MTEHVYYQLIICKTELFNQLFLLENEFYAIIYFVCIMNVNCILELYCAVRHF